jgi:hypothetical protein
MCLCVRVSEELADGVVHDAAPIDVVGVHRRVLQGTQDVETCVCVLEGADDEVIDGVPSDEAVELLLSIHLLECTCVCHVCHVFVCLSAGRNRTSPSTMCACLCVPQRQSSMDTSSAA